MIEAKTLRNKENIKRIEIGPGYYKWWAKQSELDVILDALEVNFDDVKSAIETKENLYCIYVGIAVNESVRQRLNWHVNDQHTKSKVKNGTLSTLRQSISSIVAHNQYDKKASDDFIDKLSVEYFISTHPVKSPEAKQELHTTEKQLLDSHLRVLNIQCNNHPLAKKMKKRLKHLRKISKAENP